METLFENDDILVVKYSEKSVAIFSSKEWANENLTNLKEFGRYNPNLTYKNEKRKGWISSFKNKKLHSFLEENFNFTLEKEEIKEDFEKELLFKKEKKSIYVVKYSEKSIALFSNKEWGLKNKEEMMEYGGKWSPGITYEDLKGGWIFSFKKENTKEYFLVNFKLNISS